MITLQHPAPAGEHRLADRRPARRRRRLVALATTGAMAGTALVSAVTPVGAEEVTITDATFEWGLSAEMQSAPPFGGCNYLSAGASDGSEGDYQTSDGDVTIVKDGGTPTWDTKCDGAPAGEMDQKVVWSGGTGTVDTDTGEATIAFTGNASVNFYGGLVPFTIVDPVITVDAAGSGQLVATLVGYESDMDNPFEKFPLDPVHDIVVADLSDVASDNDTGFTVTPDYEGVEIEVEDGYPPQNRTNPGWGSWPQSFVDFHFDTGLSSYWYSSGGAADPKKAPSALSITYNGDGNGDPGNGDPTDPGDGEQIITATVPDGDPADGEFIWTIDGDGHVDLGEATSQGTFLQASGAIDPVTVTDTRAGGPEWSISGQVSDFTGGIPGANLGWDPQVLDPGAGAFAGDVVPSGIEGGDGLSGPSLLAAAPDGHDGGSATLGADLDLRLPVDTDPGTYSATLTITALT